MTLLTFTQISFAAELPLCEKKNVIKFNQTVNGVKVTLVKGPVARDMYNTLQVKELSPAQGRFDIDPNDKAKVKLGKHQTCLKVQPAKYLDNEYFGQADCLSYRCQILEEN